MINKKIIFLGLFVLFFFGIVCFEYAKAETDCNVLSGDEKDKCEELERKEELYTQMIEIKRKQKETLENQLSINKLTMENLEEQNQIQHAAN